jgi:hypothetical protein
MSTPKRFRRLSTSNLPSETLHARLKTHQRGECRRKSAIFFGRNCGENDVLEGAAKAGWGSPRAGATPPEPSAPAPDTRVPANRAPLSANSRRAPRCKIVSQGPALGAANGAESIIMARTAGFQDPCQRKGTGDTPPLSGRSCRFAVPAPHLRRIIVVLRVQAPDCRR